MIESVDDNDLDDARAAFGHLMNSGRIPPYKMVSMSNPDKKEYWGHIWVNRDDNNIENSKL